jgi:hypothetical protein
MISKEDAETLFKSFGYDEPEVMYATGKHHKWLCEKMHKPEPKDVNGLPLVDGEVYELTKTGFRLV